MHLQVQILFGMAYYKKRGPLSKLFYCKNLLLLKVWIPLVGTYTIYNFLKKKNMYSEGVEWRNDVG